MNHFLRAIRDDVRRFTFGRHPLLSLGAIGTVLCKPGLQALLVYRFGRMLQDYASVVALWPLVAPGWLVYGVGVLLARQGFGINLSLSAEIGPGLYIGHFGGIHVENCSLGGGCSIGEQTRIGRADQPDGPRIGAYVWVGAHAHLSGAISVGDGATIAAGARVTRDVPARALAAGNPARILAREYDNRMFLGLPIEPSGGPLVEMPSVRGRAFLGGSSTKVAP